MTYYPTILNVFLKIGYFFKTFFGTTWSYCGKVSINSLTKSEGSKGSMSMSSRASSPRLSNMFVTVESASAPTIALKQVTLQVTKKILGQNKTKQK